MFDPIWSGLAEHRRTITVDVPAHGQSPSPSTDFDAAAVVDAIIENLEVAGVEHVVPMTLSHAGWVGIELRRRLGPGRVPALVLLDWMVLGPPPGFLDALAGLQNQDSWQQVRDGLFDMWTSGVDVPAPNSYVASMGGYGYGHWNRAGREISAAFLAHGSPLTALEQLEVACPTLHLYSQPTDDASLTSQQNYASTHPWFAVQRLGGSSHFPTLEVPRDITTYVEDFLRRLP